RAFLEYFSATDIVRRFHRREWTPDELVRDVFGRRWADPNWHEVLLLVAGMIDESFTGAAIGWLLRSDPLWFIKSEKAPQHILLAIRCLGEVRKLGMLSRQCKEVTDAIILLLEAAFLQPYNLRQYRQTSATLDAIQEKALPVFEAPGPPWPERGHYWGWYRGRHWWRRGVMYPLPRVAARIAAAMFSGDSK